MCRLICAFVVRIWHKQVFSWLGWINTAITSRFRIFRILTVHYRYTAKNESGSTVVYAIVLDWPEPGGFKLGAPIATKNTAVRLLGYPTHIGWKNPPKIGEPGIYLEIPAIPFNRMPCDYAWVFKMYNLKNGHEGYWDIYWFWCLWGVILKSPDLLNKNVNRQILERITWSCRW